MGVNFRAAVGQCVGGGETGRGEARTTRAGVEMQKEEGSN